LKSIITRQTICTHRLIGFIRPGLSGQAWDLRKPCSCSPKPRASSNSIPNISKSRKRLFSLAPARCWTATLSLRSGPSFVSDGSNFLLYRCHADWFRESVGRFRPSTFRPFASLYVGVTGLPRMGNQIHIYVAWQIRLPMPRSLRHHDKAQENASENCCNGNG